MPDLQGSNHPIESDKPPHANPSRVNFFGGWYYIADFVCFDRRLVVEIDGPSHDNADQIVADKVRDDWLRKQGFQVLRLSNELVIASTELAVARIRDALTR